MTYESFLKEIVSIVQERLGKTAQVCLHTIYKNNDLKKEALCILEEGSNVSPTIYLRPYYESLLEGTELEDIVRAVLAEYRQNRCGMFLDTEEFQRFDRVGPRVVYKVVNFEKNQKLLQDVPYRRFLDLAVVYYFLIENHFIGNGTAMIHNQQLKLWNVEEAELYRLASENTDRLMGNEITAMDQVIRQLLKSDLVYQIGRQTGNGDYEEEQVELMAGQILEALMPKHPYTMYVMSNRDKYCGAAAVLNHEKLSEFAREKGCGFYVIPSSIHEVILMPETEALAMPQLKNLLGDINEEAADSQEFLFDRIYYFDKEADCLRM